MARTCSPCRLSNPFRFAMAVVLLGSTVHRAAAQEPSVSPKPSATADERAERLKQSADLKARAEKQRAENRLDDAATTAGKALATDRDLFGAMSPQAADTLALLAGIHEGQGDWAAAAKAWKDVLAIRLEQSGKDHWQTAGARLALAFVEKVAGLRKLDQAKVAGALRKEQEAARLLGQGKHAEAERVALEVLETYRSLVGPEMAEVARVWHLVGRTRLGRNDARGAKEATERALAIRRKTLPRSHPDIGWSVNTLGVAHYLLREYSAAKNSFDEALALRRKSLPNDHPEIAESVNNLGGVQYALQEYAVAKRSFEEALAIYRKALPPGHPLIASILTNLGAAQHDLREHAAAMVSLEEALVIRRTALPKEHPDIASSLNSLGIVQHDLREYAAARKSHEEALAIRRKALPKDHQDIATSLNNLGSAQAELGEYAAAKVSFEEALAIFRKALPEDHPEIATSLYNLGKVQHHLRGYAAAKASYEEAVAIYRKARPPGDPDIAKSLSNLGNEQYDLREYAAARKSHEEALAIRRKALAPGHPDIAVSLYNLGLVQYDLREYAAAKASLEEALAIHRKALRPGHTVIAQSLTSLGAVQHYLREYAAARKSHEEAPAIRRKALPPGDPDIAQSLNNLGTVHWELREYAAARASFEEALAIFRKALPPGHPDIVGSLNNLGAAHSVLREYAGAKARFEEALAIRRKALPKDDPAVALVLENLARLSLASGVDVEDAVFRLSEAADIYQADHLRLAVAQAEPEQLATAATAQCCLHSLVDATIRTRANPGSAYDRVVRGKGSVTAQQRWAHEARDVADPDTARLLDRLRQITQQLLGLAMVHTKGSVGEHFSDRRSSDPQNAAALLRTLSDERAQLERQLSERSAFYSAIQVRSRVGANEVRDALPKGTALIDLFAYHFHVESLTKGQGEPSIERGLMAFVVRPDQRDVVMVPLGLEQSLAELIDRWRASYGAGKAPPTGAADPGAKLRKRLWEPLAKHLRDVKVVLVSPDGLLNGLPWAALPGSKAGTFLIHEYAFAVVPVPQLLPELLRGEPSPAKEQPSLLLAGGIAFGEESARDPKAQAGKLPLVPFFRPLPGTESEVNDLRAQFEDTFAGAPAPEVLRKDKATKKAVLGAAPSHRFVHLATHGFFADESEQSAVEVAQRAELLRGGLHLRPEAVGRHPGLLSGLVFAGVNRPDRRPEETILTALEAAELDLGKVELVVLSACETGRGQVAGGEGVLGLQRAFQLAGARSVVASLWRVPDEETHQLMREFYRRVWSEKPVSKAEALRQAQLWMLENWKPRGGLERPSPQGPPPPYVWAAFVLSGDWR